jgi:thioredoxin reductase (NADPH)
MFKGMAPMDEAGYIVTDENMCTETEGLFAAGDCRRKMFRQVVTACGDGAAAAYSAQKYIESLEGTSYPGR